jgi:hypothetical protein
VEKKKRIRRILLWVLVLLAVLAGSFLIWAGSYYHADETARAARAQDVTLKTVKNLTILTPETPGDTGVIFYPGAKVEATAYLPLLEKLKAGGLTCVLVKMPLNMAIFDKNAADEVYGLLPGIKHWYIVPDIPWAEPWPAPMPPATRRAWTDLFCWGRTYTAAIRLQNR